MATTPTASKALAITGSFEGGGWGGVDNAGDAAGWSAFTLQWNPLSGTLQPLLRDMQANGPQTFVDCLTQPVESEGGRKINLAPELLAACSMSNADMVTWCNQHQDANGQPLPHWRAAFAALGSVQGFRNVQMKHAQFYLDGAREDMAAFGFVSERAFCLLFDNRVQCGSVTPGSRSRYAAAVALIPNPTEREKLVALAHAVSLQDDRAWVQADILSRRLCIATGSGLVHGKAYDLGALFGLGDGPVVAQ